MFWYLPKIQTGKRAILALVWSEGKFLQKKLNWKRTLKWFNFYLSYHEKALLLTPILGAPALALALEFLKQLGVEEVLALGWVGTITSSLKIGEIFLPTKAYPLEGTSKIYQKGKKCFFPEKELFKRIEIFLKEKNLEFKKGSLLSTDAPWFFERSFHFLKKWLNKVEGMDMETSAFFSVCQSLNLKGVAIHLVSDEVGKLSEKTFIKIFEERRESLLGLWERFINHEI
ncbi:MAG: hypothetical protein NZ530_02780 [Thermodesulfobacteriaceae bacterium]|nr:hypothetical protein [Thermodesulfobacteriaceae bacterium]MCX8041390.1 hypothetical protein [Thermodesulfobacteriaceae bacterium]MDW8135809.1 hypothetical protein [Thermodesulfobacterium sp.]